MDPVGMPLNSPTVVRSTIALIVVGFLALLGIVGMTIWLGERAQFYFNDVIAARDMRASAVELRNALQTAEASQRGYLVTGNQIYLAPYSTAKTQAQRLLDTVKRQLASREDTQAAIRRLTSIITEKIGEMDETIALKRDRQDADALAVFRTNRGKALMDEANVFFSGIIRTADNRLTASVAEQLPEPVARDDPIWPTAAGPQRVVAPSLNVTVPVGELPLNSMENVTAWP